MATRRMLKVARVIKDSVSEVVQNHLADPRIKGMISVTRVEVAGDLHSAKVYLSIFGVNEEQQALSMRGIKNASGVFQSHLAQVLKIRVLPQLRFAMDESLKKGFETMQIINQVSEEIAERDRQRQSGAENQTGEDDDEIQ